MTHAATIREHIDAILPDLIAMRGDLHAHPELGYEEHRTSGVIRDVLTSAGIEHVGDLAGGTGVLGHHLPGRPPRLSACEPTSMRCRSSNKPGWRGPRPMRAVCTPVATTGTRPFSQAPPGCWLNWPRRSHCRTRSASSFNRPKKGAEAVNAWCRTVPGPPVLGPTVDCMYGPYGWPVLQEHMRSSDPAPCLRQPTGFNITITGLGGHAAMPHGTRDPIIAATA